jgi:microcystin-dependent protein
VNSSNSVPLTSPTSPAGASVGEMAYNTNAASGLAVGPVYWDGSQWQSVKSSPFDATVEVSGLSSGLTSPNSFSGGTFSPNTPGLTSVVYVNTTDGSTWTYNGSQYVTYAASAISNFYLANGTTDAGTNKTGSIYRTGTIGIGTSTPNAAAALDVTSTSKGVLLQRVALTAANSASPLSAFVAGMAVYNTATAGTGANAVTPGLYYCDGTKWIPTAKDYVEDPTLGSIAVFPYNALPSTYLECNGAAVSRTTYAALFAKLGTTYGAGDGSTTFNVPDLRGEFIRGFDNGRGVDSGRALGSSQSSATKLPTTALTGTTSSYTHNHGVGDGSNAANNVTAGNYGLIRRTISGESLTVGSIEPTGSGNEPDATAIPRVIPNDSHSHTVTISGGGDAETRPRNVAMVYAIKVVESVVTPNTTGSGITQAAAANEPWFKVGTTSGATANTDNVYINGNVGIGTSTPAQKLDVNGNASVNGKVLLSAGDAIKIDLFGSDNGPRIAQEGGWVTANYAGFKTSSSTGEFHWNTVDASGNDAERMRLTNGGTLAVGSTSPNASAQLDVASTTKGFLPPRMTQAQRTAISTPAAGLQVFQTDGVIGLWYYDGSQWNCLTPVTSYYLRGHRNTAQSITTAGTNVIFNTTGASNGSLIALNTSTGVITLQPGYTYEIIGGIETYYAANGVRSVWQWYNRTASSYMGNPIALYQPNEPAQSNQGSTECHAVLKVTATTNIDLRIKANASAIGSTSAADFDNDQSHTAWFFVRVLSTP